MKQHFLYTALATFLTVSLFAQSFGELHGKVFDEQGLPLVGVVVKVENGSFFTGGATDENGKFRIKPLAVAIYKLTFNYTGYSTVVRTGVNVESDIITHVAEVYLEPVPVDAIGTPIVIVSETIPLIRKDGAVIHTLGAKELKNNPSANGGNVKQMVIGMSSDIKASADGEELYFRGSRAGSVIYFIDGVKMRENVPNIPSSGIARISVYTGGLPAKYGDTTGGVVVIETKNFMTEY